MSLGIHPHLNTAAFLVSSCRILSFEDIVKESDFHGGRTIFFDRSVTPKDFSDDEEDFLADAPFFDASSSGGGGGIGAALFCRLRVLGVISAVAESAVFATFEGDDDEHSAAAGRSSGVGGRGSCCLRFLGVGPAAEGVAGGGGSARLEAV